MKLPIELIIEILIFVMVAGVSLAALRWAESTLQVRRRLGQQSSLGAGPSTSLVKSQTVSSPFLRWVQSSSLNDPKDHSKLRRELALAGFDHPAAPMWFVIVRFSLAIALPLAFLVNQSLSAKPMTGFPLIVGALIFCGIGLVAARGFIDNRANARRAELENEFPDALDLMVVCVEAGLGLEAAFVRVGQEVHTSHPRIAQEFERVSDEMSAGRSRSDALRAMADRASVDPVKSFVALLIQTDSLGTSIGQTLRTYSIEMREHRYLKAEEKAMRIPVLLTVPLVACILPVIILALLLPAGIDMARNLGPALSGIHH